jgi:hypothetical protein
MDNDITPSTAQAEADQLKAQTQELFEDMQNLIQASSKTATVVRK